jgi:hypothetical protein
MRAVIASILLGCFIVAGSVQASQYEAGPSAAPTPPTGSRTGKERLGEKATDEQRVDDCNVPPGRRSRVRPVSCPWDVETRAAVIGGPAGAMSMRQPQDAAGK